MDRARVTRMWTYTLAVVALWVVNPEFRRLLEWRTGFSSVDVLSVAPLLAVVPHMLALALGGAWRRVPRVLALGAWCWFGALGYGLVAAILAGNVASGAYTFANFVFPTVVGLWVAADEASGAVKRRRLLRLVVPLTTFVAVYGIVQYAIVPPWDGYWLANSGINSAGKPFPFQIRVFSTLNAPGPLGNYMTFALLAVLPACTLKRPLLLAQVAIWCVVLALSLDRSAWLAFAVGTTIYAAIGARRSTTIGAFAGIAVLATVAVMAVPIMTGDELALAHLTDRFSTLSDVENDRSANDRQAVYVEGTQMFLAAPLGEGLGVIGTATKLGDTQTTTDFDSGYLARLVELGIPGGALFYAALAILLAAFVGRWRAASRAGDDVARNDASFAVAFCFALFGLQLAGDVYAGFMSLLLWVVAGCVVPARAVVARASDARTPVVRPTFAALRSGVVG